MYLHHNVEKKLIEKYHKFPKITRLIFEGGDKDHQDLK